MPIDPDTQEEILDEKVGGEDEKEAEGAGGDEDGYFLEADERHRYKTKEDAIKAIKESGARIGELSAWEKEVVENFPGLTPAKTAELLDELLELRQKVKAGVTPEPKKETTPSGKVDPQTEANLKFLKDNGYLTKTEVDETLKALRDEIATLKKGNETNESERFNQRVEQGEAYITSLVKEAKYPDGITAKAIRYITGCLSEANDPDGKQFAKFMRGGAPAQELLKSLFNEFKEGLDLVRTSTKGDYQSGKEKAGEKGGKPLPKGGAGSGAPDKEKKPLTPGQKNSAVHDKAWEIMEREFAKEA